MFQLDRSQFAPKIVIRNPSGYWTTNEAKTFFAKGIATFINGPANLLNNDELF